MIKTLTIFALIFALTNCNFLKSDNFNLDLNFLEHIYDDEHGAGALFTAGFFHGLNLFNNLPHTDECLAVLPVYHDDIADIVNLFRNITKDTDFFALSRAVIDKLEHLNNAIRTACPSCKALGDEVEVVLQGLTNHLSNPDRLRVVFEHTILNIGLIKERMERGRDNWMARRYQESGDAYGDLMRFMLFWDYPASIKI